MKVTVEIEFDVLDPKALDSAAARTFLENGFGDWSEYLEDTEVGHDQRAWKGLVEVLVAGLWDRLHRYGAVDAVEIEVAEQR